MSEMSDDSQLQQALAHHRAGRLSEAEALYCQVLAASPGHPQALYLLAFLACQIGRHDAALQLADRAIRAQPNFAEAHHTRAKALNGLRQHDAALESLDRAITLDPNCAETYLTRGNAFCGLHQYPQAVAEYDHALRIQPDYPDACLNRAIALQAFEQYQAAIDSCDHALRINPDYPEAHLTRANALHALGRHQDAIASYDRAIQARPDYADAHFNRGVALQALSRHQAAIASYDHAVRLAPHHAEAWQNRGIAHLMLLDYHAALADFDRAIALKPVYPDAHNNRANTLVALGRHQDALASFLTVARQKPDYDWLPGMVLHLKSFLCDWDNFDAGTRNLEAAVLRGERAAPSFVVLALSDSPAVHRRAAEIYARANYPDPDAGCPVHAVSSHGWGPPTHPRLRIGYFSADFSAHATCTLMAELFERHDRTRFDLFAFSFGPSTPDPVRQRVAAAFPDDPDAHFLDVRAMTDPAIAQLARSLEIDIAIDLKGYTTEARPGIFAHRAAPIQINYLGYPGTMGAPFIDYLIADRTVIPPSAQPHYTEKVLYLPNTYQPNPSTRAQNPAGCPIHAASSHGWGPAETTEPGCPIHAVSSHGWGPSETTEPGCPIHAASSHGWGPETTRAAHSLPESAFVFCCFNSVYKITPTVFSSWMHILARVPTGVLWLLESNPTATANLRREAAARNIDPARLIFAPRLSEPENLTRLALADLVLDTFPYNAHTTASDALYAGVPVLTRIGESFPSRVAASLLSAIDLPDLITTTPAAYEDLAVTLAHTPALYLSLRTRLQQNRATAPLFDCPTFTRHLESLYLTLQNTRPTS